MYAASLYDLPALYDGLVPPGPCERFYRGLAEQSGGRVLELACGTGRVTVPLALDGHDVSGLDNSASMLATARAKARARSAVVTWVEADMTRFALPGRFDLIVLSCNSLAHLLADEALDACLSRVAAHLAAGGVFAFDVVNPDLKRLRRPPAPRLRRAHSSAGAFRVREHATYDPDNQILQARWEVEDRKLGATHELQPLRLRQFFPDEMRDRLGRAGLELTERYGDFDRAPFRARSRNQVCVARA